MSGTWSVDGGRWGTWAQGSSAALVSFGSSRAMGMTIIASVTNKPGIQIQRIFFIVAHPSNKPAAARAEWQLINQWKPSNYSSLRMSEIHYSQTLRLLNEGQQAQLSSTTCDKHHKRVQNSLEMWKVCLLVGM